MGARARIAAQTEASEDERQARLEFFSSMGKRAAELHFMEKRGLPVEEMGLPLSTPGKRQGMPWKNYIKAGLPPLAEGEGYTYVVGYGPYVKIGRTGADLRMRMTNLQNGAPETLWVYALLPGRSMEMEGHLHAAFMHLRLSGEWFRLEGDLADWISEGCP